VQKRGVEDEKRHVSTGLLHVAGVSTFGRLVMWLEEEGECVRRRSGYEGGA